MSSWAAPVQQFRAPRWVAIVFGTRGADLSVDVMLVVVRVAMAWIFIYYGGGKLFGWFDGPGLDSTALFMSDTAGLSPGKLFAVLGGLIELGGGIAVGLGILSRLAALALLGDMVMAIITVTGSKGVHADQGAGYEINLALAALALVIVVLGAGRFSLDALAERRFLAAAPSTNSPSR